MENNAESFGWQVNACAGAVSLVPTATASYDTTAVSFAVPTDAVFGGLGQPKAMRTHKSITRPGSPPRGRLR